MADTQSPATDSPDPEHLTVPPEIDGYPPGIPYIVGNEAAERFSFYGMKAILTVFLVQHLKDYTTGAKSVMTDGEATATVHLFVSAVYFLPIAGALLADAFIGKYKTIFWLSLVYCLGHGALALDESRVGVYIGLALIAIGSGGIKPCVTAHVGDQFGTRNEHLRSRVFGWFYVAVNLGAATSSLLTPILLDVYGPAIAFGVPGVLMVVATYAFWLGRTKFVHIPPAGANAVFGALKTKEGWQIIGRLASVFIFVSVFWALFDQTATTWVLQADRLDREIGFLGGIELLPSQVQAANPILILILVPVFSFAIYPAINEVFPLTPLRKMSLGMFLTVAAFSLPALTESWIEGGSFAARVAASDDKTNPAVALIDDKYSKGWLSTGKAKPPTEDELKNDEAFSFVLRLRDRKAWTINELGINPATTATDEYRKSGKKNEDGTTEPVPDVEQSWLKRVRIEVGDVPKPAKEDGWRLAGEFDLKQTDELQTFAFPEALTGQYVRVTPLANFGGPRIGIGKIQILNEQGDDVVKITNKPSILWQLLAYILLTAAEVMVSITAYEFAYTQSPVEMKSLIMSLYLLSITVGNLIVSAINVIIVNEDGTTLLDGAAYFWFFTALMLVAAIGFAVRTSFYQYRSFGATAKLDGESDVPVEPQTPPDPETDA